MRTATLLERILLARYPNTNSIESMTFDLPLPLGPTMEEKHCNDMGEGGGGVIDFTSYHKTKQRLVEVNTTSKVGLHIFL